MGYKAAIKKYLKDIQKEYFDALSDKQHTAELSFRTQLHVLLKDLAKILNPSTDIAVILEPKGQGKAGRPDFLIHDKKTLGIFGYIEAKGPSTTPFDITPYTKQIEKYKTLGHNLIITDGIDFVFCLKSIDKPFVISLIDKSRMSSKNWSSVTIDNQFETYISTFFSNPSPQQVTEERLVELIAVRTKNLADEISEADIPADEITNDSERKLVDLFSDIKKLIYNHNDSSMRNEKVFAGFTAQVIMFCLLYAYRVLCNSSDSPIEKETKIKTYINNDLTAGEVLSPFRYLMIYLRDNTDNSVFIMQWIDECIKFLSFVQMTTVQLLNPDYHKLFELFLAKYDPKTRFDYGAFYTPQSLSTFVVRLVNYIVKQDFNGTSIYDKGNTLIDPCCGTGSFLEQIVLNDPGDGEYSLCGFEILPTPYMLANYRMSVLDNHSQKRKHTNTIILTNTLCNGVFGEAVNEKTIEGKELKRASDLSSMPLKLIIGNPPCSDSMQENNTDDFSIINELMNDFRPPIESRHSRQNTQKQINNPFMQFIRWSCKKLLDSKCHSVLALVIPLSFLDAESYQYAREYLCNHFSNAWIVAIDADGRAGIRTDSLFNTLQGRAVLVLTHKYLEANKVSQFRFYDITQDSKTEKEKVFLNSINTTCSNFTKHALDTNHYKLLPIEPIDEQLYSQFWPISNDDHNPSVFINQVSGIKLGGTSLLVNVKSGMIKRRSKEILNGGYQIAQDWTKHSGQKTAQKDKVTDFCNRLKSVGNTNKIEKLIDDNTENYSFRPFLLSKVFLWSDLLQHWRSVGGGGTRYRKEIMAAYSSKKTIGFSVAHAPKDLNSELGQFVSFCWYYPDNDLSSRGNGHIYLNQFPDGDSTIRTNINDVLLQKVSTLTGLSNKVAADRIVFYTYAVLCSQVYLEKFKGALYIPNQSDARARIPITNNANVFNELSTLGENIAVLEKENHKIDNLLNFDYQALCSNIPKDFKMRADKPFDDVNGYLIINDDDNYLQITCPIYLQKLNIAGYEVIKTWLKFHQFASTHCTFSADDMKSILDFLNTLEMDVQYIKSVDVIVRKLLDSNDFIKP